ncbi:AraC family transcriptional regulator [Mycolicibacterium mageritense]|uniref:AraC family transcriptional regulator n=1 Tax=Mycolicibacterium mageritense TaxID=53462 RepID=UPI001E617D30|nr:AraC family transcriptional regulator [Mycolicibacterium mageritense]
MSIDVEFVNLPLHGGSADAGFSTPHHTIIVYRGGGVLAKEYELEKGQSLRVEKPKLGNAWVLPAEHRAAVLCRGAAMARYCQLTVSTDALGAQPLRPSVRRDPLLHQLIERMGSLADRGDVLARIMRETLTETLRLHLTDQYGPPVPDRRKMATPRALDESTQAVLEEYLNDSLDSRISLAAMAELAGMPVSAFTKAFADAFHTTPHQYLLNQRIARAQSLLVDATLTVSEIAFAVGFSTPGHFSTTFKARVGITPSQYRRQAIG